MLLVRPTDVGSGHHHRLAQEIVRERFGFSGFERRSSIERGGSAFDVFMASSSVGPSRSPAAAKSSSRFEPGVALQPDPQRGQDGSVRLGEPCRHLHLGQDLLGPRQESLVISSIVVAYHVHARTSSAWT